MRSSVPELPKNVKELEELLRKKFEILEKSSPISDTTSGEYHPGDVAIILVKKKCPFCGMIFDVVVKRGCFGSEENPHNCPNCYFPNNVIEALVKKKEQKTNK